jgi:hypothetical protein
MPAPEGHLAHPFHAHFIGDGGGLARLDKRARIFHRRLLQNTVAQVQDVANAARALDSLASRLAHALFRTEEDAWIDVALQRDARPDLIADRREIHAPIDAQHICS